MKKIIIIAVIIVILAATMVLLIINKNNSEPQVETIMVRLENDGSYSVVEKVDIEAERDTITRINLENTIADILSEFEWVNSAVVGIAYDNSSVSAVFDISREPSPDETEAAAHIITFYVDGLEEEDIFITDQNSNVIYSFSE